MIISSPQTPLSFASGTVGSGLGTSSQNSATSQDFNGVLAGFGNESQSVPNGPPAESHDDERQDATDASNGGSADVAKLATRAADTSPDAPRVVTPPGTWPAAVHAQTDAPPQLPTRGRAPQDAPAKPASTKSTDGKSTDGKSTDGKSTTTADQQSGSVAPSTTQPPGDLLALLTSSAASGSLALLGVMTAPSRGGRSDAQGANQAATPGDTAAVSAHGDTSLPSTQSSATLVSQIKVESHVAPAAIAPTGQSPGKEADSKPTGAAPSDTSTADRPSESGVQATGAAAPATAAPTTSASTAQADGSALPTVRAIANAVGDLASQAAAASDASAVPDDVNSAVPAPARTLTLQLSPANLGTVSVRLHVSGQTLDVEIALSDHQTLGMVSRDRDALASALRDQSYDVNSLVIQGGDATTFGSGEQHAQFQDPGSGSSAADGGPAAREGGGGNQGGWQGADREARGTEPGATDVAPSSGGGALFV